MCGFNWIADDLAAQPRKSKNTAILSKTATISPSTIYFAHAGRINQATWLSMMALGSIFFEIVN
jgi:hypothetical protein